MEHYTNLLIFVFGFSVIALASGQIGRLFVKAKLPLITGFLFTGIIAGPFILDLIHEEAITRLRFVDEISLAFIAFAAGSELYLKELRSRFKSIAWVTMGNLIVIPTLGAFAIFSLADFIPFMRDMAFSGRIAVSILAGAILVARSPSSAIAVVNELRAKGPFTQTALGVTMITDVGVIVLFAINSSVTDALLTGLGLDLTFVVLLLAELLLSLLLGYLLGKVLAFILSRHVPRIVKTGGILLAGFAIFILSAQIREINHTRLSFEIFLEPLLICMVGSFVVTNYTRFRPEFVTTQAYKRIAH
jgi:Kef-type K+ transport system membrane component KefB